MPTLPRLRFALTFFCLGSIVAHGVIFWVVRQQIASGSSDFRIFYAAGLMLRRGEGRVLYDEALQDRTTREFALPAIKRGGPLPYNHPPFEATLFLPFTYLPYLTAYCLWFAINLILLAGSIYHIREFVPTLPADFRWFLTLVSLAYFPIAYAFLQGQDSILLMVLYFAAYVAMRQGRDWMAGAYLGLGLFKFHLVLPFAFILLLRRRWRALGGMSLVAAVELAISWVLVGGKQLFYYPLFVWQVNRRQAPGVISPSNMANLRGLLMGWDAIDPRSQGLRMLLLVVSLGLLVWAATQWRESAQNRTGWDFGFSACLVVTFLVGYHGYSHDMSFLLLPILLSANYILANWSKTNIGFKVILALTLFNPLYLFLTLQLSHQNFFAIVLLCFAGYLAAFAAKTEPAASADTNTALIGVPPA